MTAAQKKSRRIVANYNYNHRIAVKRNRLISQIVEFDASLSAVKLNDFGIAHGNLKLINVRNTLMAAQDLKTQFKA